MGVLTVRPEAEARAPSLYDSLMCEKANRNHSVTSFGHLTVSYVTVTTSINSK